MFSKSVRWEFDRLEAKQGMPRRVDRPPAGRYAIFVRVLGVDVGKRRIGLAISDASGTLARPLLVLQPVGDVTAHVATVAAEIARLNDEEEGLAGVVVGVPRALNGKSHRLTAWALDFVEILRERVLLPVSVQDERLTSHEAESRLAVTEKSWRKRKLRLDAAAAAVLLQDYLDCH